MSRESAGGPGRRAQRARVSVIATFFLNGFVAAMWVVNIPAISARTGINHTVLGLELLVLGAGLVIAMRLGGIASDRWGTTVVAGAGLAVSVGAVVLPGVAHTPWELAAALFVFGLANGCVDIAMNGQAVLVERRYQRPIMASFHAFWSIGGAVGAVYGALCQAAGVSLVGSLLGASAVVALGAVGCVRGFVTDHGGSRAQKSRAGREHRKHVVVLGALAFALCLAEGTANDWSALHAVEYRHQSEVYASLAYAAFAVAMTAGRLAADRVSGRWGAEAMMRRGSGLAALGFVLVVWGPIYPLTVAGWVIAGLGLAGVLPLIFSAAGNLNPAAAAATMSRVVSMGYLGLLAGPGLIGGLSGLLGLPAGFLMVALLCTAVALSARVLRPAPLSGRG